MRNMIRKFIKALVLKRRFLRRPSVSYCVNNFLLPEVLVSTPSAELRKLLLLPPSPYRTQLNQDIYAFLVNRFNPGYFLEIGANDGFTLSNTHYLEKCFGWMGLLVEANPKFRESLQQRSSNSVIAAIANEERDYLFCDAGLYGGLLDSLDATHMNITRDSVTITVRGTTLKNVLSEHSAPSVINFVSIDVEGAEVPIVEQLCQLTDYRFTCGCIEHNNRLDDYCRMTRLLEQAGYRITWNGRTSHDLFFVDENSKGFLGSAIDT